MQGAKAPSPKTRIAIKKLPWPLSNVRGVSFLLREATRPCPSAMAQIRLM